MENDVSTMWLVGLGFQLLVQIGVIVTLSIMMFDTYPFRVGLMVWFNYCYCVALVEFHLEANIIDISCTLYLYKPAYFRGW